MIRLITMLFTATFASNAQASDIGVTRHVGLGLQGGTSNTITVKYFATPEMGASFHLGLDLWHGGIHGRIQFEHEIVQLFELDWGRMGGYYQVGVGVNGGASGRWIFNPGIVAGVGLSLQFVPVPIEAFFEADIIFFPRTFWDPTIFPVAPIFGTGLRWYF